MYFVTPSDPAITLIGIRETQLYGFGEKDGKLCIYTKSVFDIGGWKEYYLSDIKTVKAKCCGTGIHVATGLDLVGKNVKIKIAAREDKFTRIFSLNVDTKEFIRYKMLEDIYPEFALLNLNLCSTCISPTIRCSDRYPNYISMIITPHKYQENNGVFQICGSINESGHCLLWNKMDSFQLVHPPVSSNILVNGDTSEALSVMNRLEDGIVQNLSVEYEDTQIGINMRADNSIEWIWHEVAFCEGFCLTRRRQDDGKHIINLYGVLFFLNGNPISFGKLEYCAVDSNFPSIDSTKFFISWHKVDKEYITKPTIIKPFESTFQSYIIPSFIVAQTNDGCNVVVISFRMLSLSEAACLSLTRIPQPSSQHRPLSVAKVSIFRYIFQWILKFFGFNQSKKEDALWMSIEFIKKKIGWPAILPLTNAPNLSMYSK